MRTRSATLMPCDPAAVRSSVSHSTGTRTRISHADAAGCGVPVESRWSFCGVGITGTIDEPPAVR